MRDHILLFLNGSPVRVSGADAFLTLSEFVRRRQGLTGTKVVCAEGDCGSCAVLIGRPDSLGGVKYASVTSCIQLVFQLDGAHVVTVEGLAQATLPPDQATGRHLAESQGRNGDGVVSGNGRAAVHAHAPVGPELNPIQESMVACHGAQCGFCTPGIVVSLYDLMQDGRAIDAQSVTRGLVGNLCRCTGYDSIVQSALKTDRARLKPIDAVYPPAPLAASLLAAAGEGVRIEAGGKSFFKPTTLDAACQHHLDQPQDMLVAGATDLGVVHNKRLKPIERSMSLSALPELRGVRVEPSPNATKSESGKVLYIGAGESLLALERAANEHLPELGRFMAWFGSPLIKNAGTIGGNLVTGSPIGDTLPPLTALEAEIEIAGPGAKRRRLGLADFYTGYRQTALGPGELMVGVRIPIPAPTDLFKLYKVSRRKDLDISGFSAAIWMQIEAGTIRQARLAFGGVGPMVLRMKQTEAALVGQPPTAEVFRQASEIAKAEVSPITDVRGSADYRRMLARNILIKFWHEAVEDRRVKA